MKWRTRVIVLHAKDMLHNMDEVCSLSYSGKLDMYLRYLIKRQYKDFD